MALVLNTSMKLKALIADWMSYRLPARVKLTKLDGKNTRRVRIANNLEKSPV